MIKILLYDEQTVYRILSRLNEYVPESQIRNVAQDTVWLDDMYFTFSNKSVLINNFGKKISRDKLEKLLRLMLTGEEFLLMEGSQTHNYIEKLSDSLPLFSTCARGI